MKKAIELYDEAGSLGVIWLNTTNYAVDFGTIRTILNRHRTENPDEYTLTGFIRLLKNRFKSNFEFIDRNCDRIKF